MASRAAKQKATLFEMGEEERAEVESANDIADSQTLEQTGPHSSSLPAAEETRKAPVVYVIDSHSLIYQVFHAMPEMSSSTGQPVGAVHGFIRDVLDILENKQPDYLFYAFDFSGDTFRHKLYPEYKAKRGEMPIDLRSQIGSIRRVLNAMNVPVLELDQYEADDILATIARECDGRGWDCYLVTADKDCRQLISDHKARTEHPQARGDGCRGRSWRIGGSGLIKWSTFNRWWVTRSITSQACR